MLATLNERVMHVVGQLKVDPQLKLVPEDRWTVLIEIMSDSRYWNRGGSQQDPTLEDIERTIREEELHSFLESGPPSSQR